MPRIICPPRDDLGHLRTPLTAGERQVLDFFDRHLPQGWEIYVQPHLNGLRPDFVLLHPSAGIGVFEVKDWNLDALRYFVRAEGGSPTLWCQDRAGTTFRQRDNPVEQVARYKREILDLYCPRLGILAGADVKAFSVITAGVIMPAADTDRAAALLRPFLPEFNSLGDQAKYYPIAGRDALAGGDLSRVFPGGKWLSSKFMTADLAEDLRGWLREPDHAAAQREPLPLNDRQHDLATTRTRTGYRRVKGPAGCGKSLALAARASRLAGEGKEVLVVSFNITLLHYLRDLAVRYPHPRESVIRGITWLHFHDWCKRVCQDAGMEEEYGRLFADSAAARRGDEGERNALFEVRIPELVGRALTEAGDEAVRYDAVLTDEGQDFNLTWWNLLRRVCRAGGEMLLAADATQDLYRRSCHWTDESMRGAGFDGPWFQLDGCYRFPRDLLPHLRRFAEDYLPGKEVNLPTEAQGDLFNQPVHLRWVQVDEVDAGDECVRAVCDLATAPGVAWADITLLAGTHEEGLHCVQTLEALTRNVKVAHVFAPDHATQKQLKMAFWMGDARLKAATIHSFKGWEARALVVRIGRAAAAGELAAAYVALSRLRRSEAGSHLTVVCSAPQLEGYGRTWPAFQDRRTGLADPWDDPAFFEQWLREHPFVETVQEPSFDGVDDACEDGEDIPF